MFNKQDVIVYLTNCVLLTDVLNGCFLIQLGKQIG